MLPEVAGSKTPEPDHATALVKATNGGGPPEFANCACDPAAQPPTSLSTHMCV